MGNEIYTWRSGVFLATATFGAYINSVPKGFRIESVNFLATMFHGWVAPAVSKVGFDITTGVVPYIKQLQEDGFLRRQGRSNPPRYLLTNDGLVELVRQVMRRGFYERLDDFFFVHSYVENYSPRTLHMLERDTARYPYQLKVQMEALLDLQEFARDQLKHVHNEIKVIDERMKEQEEVVSKIASMKGKDIDEILDRINEENPYVIDSKKPVESFLTDGNKKRILWELTDGGIRRSKQMWRFRKEQLELHANQLNQLLESTRERQRSDSRLLNLKELPDLGPFKK